MYLVYLLLAMGVQAHVKFFFSSDDSGTGRPVRNAPGPSLDGQLSVSGPCGGAEAWGENGSSAAQQGEAVTMMINYNGGHKSAQNRFRAIWACGSPTQTDMEDGATEFVMTNNDGTWTDPGNECEIVNCPDFTDDEYCPAVDGNDYQPGYILRCTLPESMIGDCTVSMIDQRDWGGCYDIKVAKAEVSTPAPIQTRDGTNPSLTDDPSLTVPMIGTYYFTDNIDTSPSDGDCCEFKYGKFDIFEYKGKMHMSIDMQGSCPKLQIGAFEKYYMISLEEKQSGALVGEVEIGEYMFDVQADDGIIMLMDQGTDAPAICDGVFQHSELITSAVKDVPTHMALGLPLFIIWLTVYN